MIDWKIQELEREANELWDRIDQIEEEQAALRKAKQEDLMQGKMIMEEL